ncbi:MAG: M20/M25/M40 family metallo-hydrolase [Pirellulales bacterium]
MKLSLRTARPGRPMALLLVALAVIGQTHRASGGDTVLNAAMESITTGDLKRHAVLLSNDTFEGREAGSRGGRAASVYLAKELQRLGLAGGAADGSYFQPFNGNSRNILAKLEGSDPLLQEQVVVVSAHYDHVGYGNQQNSFGPIGHIHNGADDNASGTAGLVEVIEACKKLPEAPRRTILFAFWDAEEAGLLGSKHWLEHPSIPLSHIVAMLNADMIGRLRGERVEILGSRTAPGFRQLVSFQNEQLNLLLDFTWTMKEDSDHYSFFAKNIPVLMLHTGLHNDYHRPSDDAEKLDIPGLERVSRLMFLTTCSLANAERLPKFRAASRHETPESQILQERPLGPLPGRMGVQWDPQPSQEPGIRVTGVTPKSAASIAGIQVGDRLLRVGNRDLHDGEVFRRVVLAARGPLDFAVQRRGQDEPLTVRVRPTGAPVRVGVTWRLDDAEPGAATLTRVVPGSPADDAGLLVNDRVYEVGGKAFHTSDQFHRLLLDQPRPMPVLVERAGRLLTIQVPAPLDLEPTDAEEEETPATARQQPRLILPGPVGSNSR